MRPAVAPTAVLGDDPLGTQPWVTSLRYVGSVANPLVLWRRDSTLIILLPPTTLEGWRLGDLVSPLEDRSSLLTILLSCLDGILEMPQ